MLLPSKPIQLSLTIPNLRNPLRNYCFFSEASLPYCAKALKFQRSSSSPTSLIWKFVLSGFKTWWIKRKEGKLRVRWQEEHRGPLGCVQLE